MFKFHKRSFLLLNLMMLVGSLLSINACTNRTPIVEQRLIGDRLKLLWTHDTGAPINEPPLRVGEVVLSVPQRGSLLALDINSGELVWEYAPPEGVWDRAYASDGDLIFIGLQGGGLAALDSKSGQVRWQQQLGQNIQAPPLAVEGILYATTTFVGPGLDGDPDGQAKLVALKADSGEILWEFTSNSYILQTPAIFGDMLYTGGGYNDPSAEVDEGGPVRVYKISAQEGKSQWVYESEDGYVKALYANQAAVAYIAYQDYVNGIDSKTGKLIWRKDTGNWVPSLSGSGEVVYYGSANTVVKAVNITSGDTLWSYNIPGGSFNYALGKPLRILDEIYILSQKGDIIALDALDGSYLWSLATGITSRVGMSVSGNWLFIGDQDGKVYAYRSD